MTASLKELHSAPKPGKRAATRAPQAGDVAQPPLSRLARVSVLDCKIDPLTMAQTVQRVSLAIAEKKTLNISVVNVAKLVNMRRDPELRDCVQSGDLVLADGAPVVWLSRWKGTPLPQRVAGIDLMFELFALAARDGLRVFLLGAKSEVIERVVEIARRDYPEIKIAGHRNGYFSAADEEAIARSIHDAQADLLFVAMTSPKKEIFMRRWGSVMQVKVCHGVGGSFDVMAGVTKRAPAWMQVCGLEWFFRVLQEPRRMWRRYLVTNTVFLALAIREVLWRRRTE